MLVTLYIRYNFYVKIFFIIILFQDKIVQKYFEINTLPIKVQ